MPGPSFCLSLAVQAAPDRYRDHGGRDRRGWEVHRPGHIIHELPAGCRVVEIRGVRYYERGGVYFRSAPDGYLVVDPPDVAVVATPSIGTVIATLPVGAVTVSVGGNVFYRNGNIFYRRHNSGFIVVEPPPSVVMVPSQPAPPQVISAGPAPAATTDYMTIWAGDQEFLTRDGQFYKRTPAGLQPVEAPIGAMLSAPPAGSIDMWIGDTEFFYFNSTFYQKRPSGYQVVVPPPNTYIKSIPKSAKTIHTNGQKLFYLGGNFYQQKDQGFLITAPPIVLTPPASAEGSVLPAPPDGAVELWVNDIEYYYYAGNFYRKQPAGFVVVANPL